MENNTTTPQRHGANLTTLNKLQALLAASVDRYEQFEAHGRETTGLTAQPMERLYRATQPLREALEAVCRWKASGGTVPAIERQTIATALGVRAFDDGAVHGRIIDVSTHRLTYATTKRLEQVQEEICPREDRQEIASQLMKLHTTDDDWSKRLRLLKRMRDMAKECHPSPTPTARRAQSELVAELKMAARLTTHAAESGYDLNKNGAAGNNWRRVLLTFKECDALYRVAVNANPDDLKDAHFWQFSAAAWPRFVRIFLDCCEELASLEVSTQPIAEQLEQL